MKTSLMTIALFTSASLIASEGTSVFADKQKLQLQNNEDALTINYYNSAYQIDSENKISKYLTDLDIDLEKGTMTLEQVSDLNNALENGYFEKSDVNEAMELGDLFGPMSKRVVVERFEFADCEVFTPEHSNNLSDLENYVPFIGLHTDYLVCEKYRVSFHNKNSNSTVVNPALTEQEANEKKEFIEKYAVFGISSYNEDSDRTINGIGYRAEHLGNIIFAGKKLSLTIFNIEEELNNLLEVSLEKCDGEGNSDRDYIEDEYGDCEKYVQVNKNLLSDLLPLIDKVGGLDKTQDDPTEFDINKSYNILNEVDIPLSFSRIPLL